MRIGLLRRLQLFGSILIISRDEELQELRTLQEILDRERAGDHERIIVLDTASDMIFGAAELHQIITIEMHHLVDTRDVICTSVIENPRFRLLRSPRPSKNAGMEQKWKAGPRQHKKRRRY